MNSDGQIDQLEALRFKMKSRKPNLSSSESGEISENEMPGMRKGIPKEETFVKYGDAAREVEIDSIENAGLLGEYLSRGFRMRGL